MPAHIPIPVPPHRSVWAVPLSVIAHAGLIAALVLSMAWKSEPPAQLQAELWETIPTPPAPAPIATPPAPQPERAAKPEPVKTPVVKSPAPEPEAIAPKVIKKIVKNPQPEPEPEPPKKVVKPLAKVEPKPEVKSPPKLDPKPTPKPESKPDTSAKDAARAKETERLQKLLGGAPVIGTPQAGSAQSLGAGWGAKLEACIEPHLRYVDPSGSKPRVEVTVKLSDSGAPLNVRISKSSGNEAFDIAVERAVYGCNPFPKPETGGYPREIVPFGYRKK
jgi:colicin import membrane protein